MFINKMEKRTNLNYLQYQPFNFESQIQTFWKKNNYFKLTKANQPTFTILMPPPNITGKLHLGHAWDLYYPDLLIRYKQQQGYNAIWYPGLDHAGIATQVKVQAELKLTPKAMENLSPTKFLTQIKKWKDDNSLAIKNQWSKLGIALNYDQLRFTLDKEVSAIVNEAFITFYRQNLIYQAKTLINWDLTLQTAISNIEVDYHDESTELYFIKYQVVGLAPLIVATSKPETIFGDKALALNPTDQRYQSYHQQFAINPLNGERLPIIIDKYVDKDFGTGVLKVTPGHDFNDFQLAKRHKLEIVSIFDEHNLYNGEGGSLSGEFANYKWLEKRQEVLKYLATIQAYDPSETLKYQSKTAYSQRSGGPVVPYYSTQWFLKSSLLAKEVLPKIKAEMINLYPNRFLNELITWLEKTEDWCISRQLIWGHKLPIWIKGETIKCQIKSPGKGYHQESGVLDTWFSSSLWPLVFENKTIQSHSDNKKYLTDTIFTGYDIIFFWIAKMIFQSYNLRHKLPFKNIIIHGLVRDNQGRKMSKSLSNGVNPIELIDKYGSDSLRLFLLSASTPGNDIKYSETRVKSNWDFNNKLFNCFKLLSSKALKANLSNLKSSLLTADELDGPTLVMVNKLVDLQNIIARNCEIYNLSFVIEQIKQFLYHDFANIYLEDIKLTNDQGRISTALKLFKAILITYHPFIPFLTEHLYLGLNPYFADLKPSIMVEATVDLTTLNRQASKEAILTMELFKLSKKLKTANNNNKLMINFYLNATFPIGKVNNALKNWNTYLNLKDFPDKFNGIDIIPNIGIIYYLFADKTAIEKKALISSKLEEINYELNRANKLLANSNFREKADEELINSEKYKRDFYNECFKAIKNEI